jgi:hypothetical protein
MDFLKNVVVNLRAKGPAAVLCVLVICITLLGVFGQGSTARFAIGVLAGTLVFLGMALAQRT